MNETAQILRSQNYTVLKFKEPFGQPKTLTVKGFEKGRKKLYDQINKLKDLDNLIKKTQPEQGCFGEGLITLVDRNYLSSMVYQQDMHVKIYDCDLAIVLVPEVQVIQERLSKRLNNDNLDTTDQKVIEQRIECYVNLSKDKRHKIMLFKKLTPLQTVDLIKKTIKDSHD